jgi:hypothetical protein
VLARLDELNLQLAHGGLVGARTCCTRKGENSSDGDSAPCEGEDTHPTTLSLLRRFRNWFVSPEERSASS